MTPEQRAHWLDDDDAVVPWAELHVCVTGLGVAGFPAAVALAVRGAEVTALDARSGEAEQDKARALGEVGARVLLGEPAGALPDDVDLVVTSPGWRPDSPVLVEAARRGVPVWGEVQLAWRLRPTWEPGVAGSRPPAPWLCVTGTNGKTTTVKMLAAMLDAAGYRAVAAGNVGLSLVDAVTADPPYDVIAVELSSFQLHWARGIRPLASAVLNVAPDHVDWHGSLEAYAADKGRIFTDTEVACVYPASDALVETLVRDADVVEGARAIGVTLGVPAIGQLGVVDDLLVDRAFIAERASSAAELGSVHDVVPFAPHNVENALFAAALARAFGVPPAAVRDGLRAFRPDPHRISHVATVEGVRWVDDSKATNPHAALASLRAFDDVVWVAGGLAKGAHFDDLVTAAAPRLRGVVLLGRDRATIAEALARHAPDVPVIEVEATDTGAMDSVVRAAAGLAVRGSTVLLAPACASMDMFPHYGARGDAFAEAVRRLAAGGG